MCISDDISNGLSVFGRIQALKHKFEPLKNVVDGNGYFLTKLIRNEIEMLFGRCARTEQELDEARAQVEALKSQLDIATKESAKDREYSTKLQDRLERISMAVNEEIK